jgi:ribosomal protein L11 methyltransferase
VLDVGCGSGVLAIGACVFGAAAAVGIDIAPAAVPTTEANAEANGVADRVAVSTTDLADVDDTFDLVLANILAPTLVALSADLRRVLAPGGALVISGILADAHDHVLAALAPLAVVESEFLDGWAAITLR